MATKTEITKILFRRGEDENRRQLYTTYGGLDVGEPGFTASDRIQPNVLSATGYTVVSGSQTPDATTITRPAVNGGVASVPGADLWMGCQQGEDIFIGGQSSELYNQSRFVPLKGTDLAWPNPYMDGKLTIGASASGHDTRFYASGASLSDQYMEWDASCAVLNLSSTTALQIPVGPGADRPGNGLGVNPGCLSAIGMIRYNTDDKVFEGLGEGPAWSSLGGARSKDGKTYITTEIPTAPDGCGNITITDSGKSTGSAHTLSFITSCEYAGKFDVDGNLYVRNDIVAFHTSDERQKENIVTIQSPLHKIYQLKGVEFDWNHNAPVWVNEDNDRHDIGVIAQNVQEVVPEAVTVRDNGYLAVDYKKLIPLLIEGIKELNTKVNYLESKLHRRKK